MFTTTSTISHTCHHFSAALDREIAERWAKEQAVVKESKREEEWNKREASREELIEKDEVAAEEAEEKALLGWLDQVQPPDEGANGKGKGKGKGKKGPR